MSAPVLVWIHRNHGNHTSTKESSLAKLMFEWYNWVYFVTWLFWANQYPALLGVCIVERWYCMQVPLQCAQGRKWKTHFSANACITAWNEAKISNSLNIRRSNDDNDNNNNNNNSESNGVIINQQLIKTGDDVSKSYRHDNEDVIWLLDII